MAKKPVDKDSAKIKSLKADVRRVEATANHIVADLETGIHSRLAHANDALYNAKKEVTNSTAQLRSAAHAIQEVLTTMNSGGYMTKAEFEEKLSKQLAVVVLFTAFCVILMATITIYGKP